MTYKKIISSLFTSTFIIWAQFFIVILVNASEPPAEIRKSFISRYINHATFCTEELNKTTHSLKLNKAAKNRETPEQKNSRRQIRSFVSLAELLEDKYSVCVAIFYPKDGTGIYVSANGYIENIKNRMETIKKFLGSKEYYTNYYMVISDLLPNSNHSGDRIEHRLNRLSRSLPETVKQVILDNKIKYISYKSTVKSSPNILHAEMQLMQYFTKVLREKKLVGTLGISKLCCQSCVTGLYAIKKYSPIDVNLETVGAHGGGFRNVGLPDFIFDGKILPHFLGKKLHLEIINYCNTQEYDFDKYKSFIKYIINEANKSPEGYKLKAPGKIITEVSEETSTERSEELTEIPASRCLPSAQESNSTNKPHSQTSSRTKDPRSTSSFQAQAASHPRNHATALPAKSSQQQVLSRTNDKDKNTTTKTSSSSSKKRHHKNSHN